ncbi:MAG: PCRF domain-containing protein, partial [Ruminococcaceae bacterium]|nr:PCRF domain-containing protein [Oscillospiraceae bacterium]
MIIQLEEAKRELIKIDEEIDELGNAMKIEELRVSVAALEEKTLDPGFWNNPESSTILQQIKSMKGKIEAFENLKKRCEDAGVLAEMGLEENDESVLEEVISERDSIVKEIETRRIATLLSGEYDKNNAIVSFHPGAGGTEAQDWAQMLYRMYTRWGERNGFNVKLIDWLDGDEAGLKSATIMIEGENAYGYLKGENGVHRLVRVSPFDSSGRRHTSF